MTDKRILELAYTGALQVWVETKRKSSRCRAGVIEKHREEVAWNELLEISKLLREEETKEEN